LNFVVKIEKEAFDDLKKIKDQKLLRQIQKKLNQLQENPQHNAITLKEPRDAQFRIRSGNYRILFDLQDTLIKIIRIRHRREVYKRK